MSALCQHEADPQRLGPSESVVHKAKRTGVIRKIQLNHIVKIPGVRVGIEIPQDCSIKQVV